ncbi:BCCT family transporter [Pelagibacterium sp. 26DY04]|uniref:BCCT family transporter n=1 Tax=Pelagibacterium sp. 26DY04 TaxID=2967130 RepID=UPI002814FC67|nr:BCCT family transporter [Pelagibacterium sp. 26DY04]WMT87386.1 BCCT family transporter [Pelagibacterium sp. 26DY04]
MFGFVINPPVFFGSLIIIALFLGVGLLAPSQASVFFDQLQSTILDQFGWLYLLAVGIMLIAVLLFAFSRFGDLKLGPDDATPDFAYHSWIAMLFAAGMGIGLMYYGVGEPVSHYASPPEAEPFTIQAVREALSSTFFHWGIHAWAVYAVVGLALAYFGYRYNLPLTIRSGLYPLLKEKIHGPIGHVVDVFAIVGTVFGLATSLGFGVDQISTGLHYLVGFPNSIEFQVALVAGIIAIAGLSVVTGVDKGVRILSEINLSVAVLLMIFVLLVGPTGQLLRDLVTNIGLYLDRFVLMTFNIYAYDPRQWIEDWTLFYWAWWISWSPFVGMFIARISRGRTVREFLVSVLFIPAGFTFIWMTIFGNTGIFVDMNMAAGALSTAITDDISVGLFQFFEYLPLSGITSTLAIILVSVFFITSADSGSLVVDTIAAGGRTDTKAVQRLFWCVVCGATAALLMLAGGLEALQSATIASALPFTVVMLVLVWSMFTGMRADLHAQQAPVGTFAPHPVTSATWQRRLAMMLRAPTAREVDAFIDQEVPPALEAVRAELEKRGQQAEVTRNEETGSAALTLPAEGYRDFVYGVHRAEHKLPAFSAHDATLPDYRYEARTYFSDGSMGYDIMGLSRDQIIADVLAQFERYLTLVASPQSQLLSGAPEHEPEVVEVNSSSS